MMLNWHRVGLTKRSQNCMKKMSFHGMAVPMSTPASKALKRPGSKTRQVPHQGHPHELWCSCNSCTHTDCTISAYRRIAKVVPGEMLQRPIQSLTGMLQYTCLQRWSINITGPHLCATWFPMWSTTALSKRLRRMWLASLPTTLPDKAREYIYWINLTWELWSLFFVLSLPLGMLSRLME